jgi:PhnB protein
MPSSCVGSPRPDGKLMHAEVRLDDSVVMIADGGGDWPPVPSNVHIYVTDVDATYRRALAAGATSVQVPVKKDDAESAPSGASCVGA